MGQYKVPQNVEAEDKIIGPLTLRQFIYAVIGVAWAGLIFSIFRKVPPLMILIAFPPTLLFLLLAFYKRDGQDFEHFLVALTGYFGQTRRRLWVKEPVVEAFKLTPPPVTSTQSQRNPTEVRSQLDRLATVMDSRGSLNQLGSAQTGAPVDDRIFTPTQPTASSTEPIVQEVDILDPGQSPAAQNVNRLIEKSIQNLRAEALQQMQAEANGGVSQKLGTIAQPAKASPPPAPSPPTPQLETVQLTSPVEKIASAQAPAVVPSTSTMTAPISGDIIRLATESDDLMVSQIAAQANRVTPLAEGESVTLRNAPTKPQ